MIDEREVHVLRAVYSPMRVERVARPAQIVRQQARCDEAMREEDRRQTHRELAEQGRVQAGDTLLASEVRGGAEAAETRPSCAVPHEEEERVAGRCHYLD